MWRSTNTVLLTLCSVYGAFLMHEYYQVLLLCVIFWVYLSAVSYLKPFQGHHTSPGRVLATAVLLATSMGTLVFIPPSGLDARQAEKVFAHPTDKSAVAAPASRTMLPSTASLP